MQYEEDEISPDAEDSLEEEGGDDIPDDEPEPKREEGFKARAIRSVFEALMRSQGNVPGRDTFFALGQSHLDAAWRWRVFQTRSKAKTTFRNALRNIKKHDFFTFSQSQPAFYEWMKDRQPRIFRAIQDAVKQGKWDLVGGMWIEPDCNMPDGESFVRQRLYGQRFYLEHFGKTADVEWLPDTFGFAWTLPQILAKSGAKYFWTTKLLWNDTNPFPFRTFHWQSPDGSRILTHISPFFGLNAGDFFKKLNANRKLRDGVQLTADYSVPLETLKDALEDESIPEVLVTYGMGDGGGGPNELEIEIVRDLRKSGIVETATAHDYFSRIEQHSGNLPVWNDELYLEYHRGCYTTHGRVKRSNRRLENLVRDTEVIHTMNSLFGDIYPEEELREAWKTLLFNQFHDILPGSSIPEVYEDAYDDYERAESLCEELVRDGLRAIAARIDTRSSANQGRTPLVIYNTLSWKRTGIVRLEAPPKRSFAIHDRDGRSVPCQNFSWGDRNYVSFIARDLPDMGYRTYFIEDAPADAEHETDTPAEGFTPVSIAQYIDDSVEMENEFLKVRVDGETGWITSIIDKVNNREMLDGPANELKLYRDHNLAYPAWNIDPHYAAKPIKIPSAPDSIEITDEGPVLCTCIVKRRLRRSPVTQEIRLFAGRPMIYMVTAVDWRETRALLKASFKTAIKSDGVTAEIPYGAITRPTNRKTKWQRGRWEMPCQKWISISDGRYGAAILNDGKYGFNAEGGALAMSLLRGPVFPPPIVNAWGLSEPLSDRPRYTDQGRHVIRYAFMPHSGDWRHAELTRRGLEFNSPLQAVRTGLHEGMMPAETSSLGCEAATTYIAAVKRPEDNPGRANARFHQLIVRLVEFAGCEDTVKLMFRGGGRLEISDVSEVDLLEFGSRPAGAVDHGTVTLGMKPFEIRTIKVTLAVKSGGNGGADTAP